MNWIKVGGYILIIIPTLFIGVLLGFYLIQDYMIFLGERLPQTHIYTFENEFEELNYTRPDGGIINCLHFKAENCKGLVYYHHGNAGNIQDWGKMNVNFIKHHYDVLFYDYRGYGKSTGRIEKENQLRDDARFVLKEFLKDKEYDKLVLHGTSLGSGIAARLASEISPDALILETPYYSFTQLINVHYPYLPAKFLSKYKLKTHKYLVKLDYPVYLFHGTDDELVPFNCSVRLSELGENITLVKIKNGAHNNLPDYPVYQDELKKVLDQL